jgi:hypothetical protein
MGERLGRRGNSPEIQMVCLSVLDNMPISSRGAVSRSEAIVSKKSKYLHVMRCDAIDGGRFYVPNTWRSDVNSCLPAYMYLPTTHLLDQPDTVHISS